MGWVKMFGVVGIVVILVMVFGGFIIHGGNMAPIIEALPFEMIMIGGAALGSCFF
jgi:chemotaxis protein MotA